MINRILSNMPPVVKNLIIINALLLLLTYIMELQGIRLSTYLGLHLPVSETFRLHQFFTHMFMHGDFMHLAFNMFMLWMFGRILESNNVWGSKKFLIYYLVTGLGAAVVHSLVNYFEYLSVANKMTPEAIEYVRQEGPRLWSEGKNFTDNLAGHLNMLLNVPTVGASGAVYGVLLAFGMLFPNTDLYIMFIPVPVKAKYVVIGMIVLELVQQFGRPGSNIAHMAHLGGMLFGYILIKYWNKKSKRFY